jgi:copper chaperone CopZ
VRGVLNKMPGIAGAKIEPKNPDIVVTIDPAVTNTKAVLKGLKDGGQPARKKS